MDYPDHLSYKEFHREMQKEEKRLWMVLIKLEKAFDGVLMEVLQWVLEKTVGVREEGRFSTNSIRHT
jgi:hypothetical protein